MRGPPEQTADFMLEKLAAGDFYILCPDNEVERSLDERRIPLGGGRHASKIARRFPVGTRTSPTPSRPSPRGGEAGRRRAYFSSTLASLPSSLFPALDGAIGPDLVVHRVEAERHPHALAVREELDHTRDIVRSDARDEVGEVGVGEALQRRDLRVRDLCLRRVGMPAFFMNSICGGAVAIMAWWSSPPARRSSFRTFTEKPSGPHKDSMPSLVVQRSHTSCSEALKVRSRA